MILLKLHTVMGESTAHQWKSKLQINFTWTNTVRILCLWFQIQCKFWILKSEKSWETSLDSPKPPVPSTSPHFGVGCRSLLICPFPQKHQPGTRCHNTFFHVGEDENVSGMLSSTLSPLPPRLVKRNIFLCFWPPSSSFFPRFSLSLFFYFLFFFFIFLQDHGDLR